MGYPHVRSGLSCSPRLTLCRGAPDSDIFPGHSKNPSSITWKSPDCDVKIMKITGMKTDICTACWRLLNSPSESPLTAGSSASLASIRSLRYTHVQEATTPPALSCSPRPFSTWPPESSFWIHIWLCHSLNSFYGSPSLIGWRPWALSSFLWLPMHTCRPAPLLPRNTCL